ncbi:hypothetical protein [Salmonella phage SD-1_S14]|nr:hypothetical protein [Salmonella phage SD-1_S14]
MYNLNLISYIITTLFTFYAFVGIILLYFKFYKVFNRFYPSMENEFFFVLYVGYTLMATCFTVADGVIGIKTDSPNGSTLAFITTWSVVEFLLRLRKNMPNR